MPKLPYMKWFPADWIRDTRSLSLAAKGAWIDIINFAWEAERRGILTMPIRSLARSLGASEEETRAVLDELGDFGICEVVTLGNGEVTVECRRMKREENDRSKLRKRVEKHRDKRKSVAVKRSCNASSNAECNGGVTPHSLYSRVQKQETPPDGGEKKPPPEVPSEIEALAFSVFGGSPSGRLSEWVGLYPSSWIKAALLATEDANKSHPRYTEKILQRYQREGGPDKPDGGENAFAKPQPDGDPYKNLPTKAPRW